MAANFLSKNKKVFDVFLRHTNLAAVSAGTCGATASSSGGTPSGTLFQGHKVSKFGQPDQFSCYAGRAVPYSQPSRQIPNMKKFDEFRTKVSWAIADKNSFATQPKRTFLLGHNTMITTYKTDPASVIYRRGKHQFALPSAYANIRCATLLPDDSFVICDKNVLIFFNSNCEYLTSSKLITGYPSTITSDRNGNIFVGMLDTKTIAVYQQDGSFGGLFRTESGPLSLAVTPNDQLVVSFVDGNVQLVDLQDTSFSNSYLKPPSLPSREWHPTEVCCSAEGDIFVVDWGHGAVYQYLPNGDYLAVVCDGLEDPKDIAVSKNGRELQVFETGLSAQVDAIPEAAFVKTFRLEE